MSGTISQSVRVRCAVCVCVGGNIIIEYPAAKPAVAKDVSSVAFVGSHLDVVYANPETWERDPFKLTVEGDKLYGRGTTDCLGHCALLTDLFKQLAEKKPQLSVSVFGVLIVDEESGGRLPIGVDELMKHGELDAMKNGPLVWLDCADAQPNIGSGPSLASQFLSPPPIHPWR